MGSITDPANSRCTGVHSVCYAQTLHCRNGTIKMNGRIITNLRFADDIGGLTGSEDEMISLANTISEVASKFGMEINPTKTKLILNNNTCNPNIIIQIEHIETVNHFKYLGSIIDEQGSRKEILARAAQANQVCSNLKVIWIDTLDQDIS